MQAATAFLRKASPVPQPCQTAVRAGRQEQVLSTSKPLAKEEEQNPLFAKSALLLWHQMRGGILCLSSFHMYRQMEERKGRQTPCSVAQSGFSAAFQAQSPLDALKEWHWFIYNSQSDWGRTWRDCDRSIEGMEEWGDVCWGRMPMCINPSGAGEETESRACEASFCHRWGWWQRSKGQPPPNEWGWSGSTTRTAFGTEDSSRGCGKLLLEGTAVGTAITFHFLLPEAQPCCFAPSLLIRFFSFILSIFFQPLVSAQVLIFSFFTLWRPHIMMFT